MATSVLVTTIDHATDKTQVKSLTNINPEASAAKLVQWIQDGVALSKDSFVSATLITEKALSTVEPQARTGNFQAFAYADGTSSSTVINDLDEFYVDINKLTSAKGGSRWTFHISYEGSVAERGTKPFPAYIESSAEDFNPNFASSWGSGDSINFGADISVALYKKIARDINLTFVIPESNGFAELRKSWTIHFINPT